MKKEKLTRHQLTQLDGIELDRQVAMAMGHPEANILVIDDYPYIAIYEALSGDRPLVFRAREDMNIVYVFERRIHEQNLQATYMANLTELLGIYSPVAGAKELFRLIHAAAEVRCRAYLITLHEVGGGK